MICSVDLEHAERGPSMLTEAPEATQRKADLVTIAARVERLAGVPCVLQHFSRVSLEVLRGLGVHTVVLSGTISISGIPSPQPGPKPPRAALDTRYAVCSVCLDPKGADRAFLRGGRTRASATWHRTRDSPGAFALELPTSRQGDWRGQRGDVFPYQKTLWKADGQNGTPTARDRTDTVRTR